MKKHLMGAIVVSLFFCVNIFAQSHIKGFAEYVSKDDAKSTEVTVKINLIGMEDDNDIKKLTLYVESKPEVIRFWVKEDEVGDRFYECFATITPELSASKLSQYVEDVGFSISVRSLTYQDYIDMEHILEDERLRWYNEN